MKLNDVLRRMPFWYANRRSVYLKSPPGRGKTSVLVQASDMLSKRLDKNLGHVVINGPLLTLGDASGYLIPKHMPDGRAESVFTDPFWFRTKEGKRLDEYDGGIIIVDEADKMDTDIKKIIGEAALSGRLGPHQLHGGWVVWMAGNRAQDRSGSTKELDHLINRRMELDIQDDLDSWKDWADENGLLPVTKAFADQNPQIVFSEGVPDKQGPWCTPRSLAAWDGYLREVTGGTEDIPEDDPLLIEEGAGMIGMGAASQYFGFVRLERRLPKFKDIVADPTGVAAPKDKPDAAMLIVYNLAERVDAKTLAPVIRYMQRLPEEFATPFAKAACKRNSELVIEPAMRQWVSKNASLMAALSV
jgi:hypothetical protein